MKVLFDQNVPAKLARSLILHQVTFARDLGWGELKNGYLLQAAEDLRFECLVTCDRNLSYQQDLKTRKIAVVVLPSGNWPQIKTKLPEIVAVVNGATAKSFFEFARVLPPATS